MKIEREETLRAFFEAASPTEEQRNRMLQTILNEQHQKGDERPMNETKKSSRKAGFMRTMAAAAAICLCCAMVMFFFRASPLTIQAYAMETGEEITSASLNSGQMNDDGSGSGAIFYLDGSDEEITSVSISAQNQYVTFMDWSPTAREKIWRQQEFTVDYGANREEYGQLVYYWDPYDAYLLLDEGSTTVADLPEELRHDVITIKAQFANGKSLTKLLYIDVTDSGEITLRMENG